ncbi:hypothetical protein [Planctomicrobium piriforme]|nr:hypothetical protein [Planctomicrobium piriforme]
MKLIFSTVDPYVAPTTKTCSRRDGSDDGFGLVLSAAAEIWATPLFVTDANAALSTAATAAANQLASNATVEQICEDACRFVSGEGTGSSNDCTAAVYIDVGVFETGDPLCDPDSESDGGTTSVHATLTVPDQMKMDMNDVLSDLDTSYFSDPSVAGAIISALQAHGGITDKGFDFWSRNISLGGSDFAYMSISTTTPIIQVNGRIGGVDSSFSCFFGVDFPLTSMSLSTITSTTGAPSIEGSTITKVLGDPITIPLEYVELNNGGGDPEVYAPQSSENFVGSGSVTVAYGDPYEVMTDPGTPHEYCAPHYTYISLYPIQANEGCWNRLWLLEDANHRDVFGLTPPPCIIVFNGSVPM